MSTTIKNASGKTVAVKFYGGQARGLCLEVFLPKNIMKDVGKTLVHEDNSPGYTQTLAEYIAAIEGRNGTIIYRQPGVHGPMNQVEDWSCGRPMR